MKLNKEKIQKFISSKPECKCQLCKSNEWGYDDKVFILPTHDRREFLSLMNLTCLNCGNTILINTKINNLLDEEDQNVV